MSTECDDQDESPCGDMYSLEQLDGPEKYREPGIPDQHPAFKKPSAVCCIPRNDIRPADRDFAQGWLGASIRLVKGVPPYVWVANGCSTPITVVVHKFKPNVKMTGGGFNANADGGGLNGEGELSSLPLP